MALKQNIIYIYFKGKHSVTSKSQYQYNHGQFLYFADLDLPQAFEVHFSNKDKGFSKPQVGSNKLVEIPDEYYWSGAQMIYAWIYLHSDSVDGETVYEVRIPLIKRAKPTDEEPLPQQESAMERAIAELNTAVEITTENANKTGEDKAQVSDIRDEVVDLKEDIDATAETVAQNAQDAIDASRRSEASAQNAAEFEDGAHDYSEEAKQYAQQALESKNTAKQKADIATNASTEALGYRDETKGYRDETLTIKNNVQTIKEQIDETADGFVTDVKVNGTSVVRDGIANITEIPTSLKYVKDDPSDNGGVVVGHVSENTASGWNAYAEGGGTTASATCSHAEGAGTRATGGQAHSEGGGTLASGAQSHAEGASTIASGDNSHAENLSTTASGACSHASGVSTIAQRKSQMVIGEYNVADTEGASGSDRGEYVFIVGNGQYHNESNAMTLDWSGNEKLAGLLTLGMGTNDETSLSASELKALKQLITQIGD